MSSVDQRVVQMKFDNAQFEQGIRTTLNSLDALNKGLKLEGATKGLNDLSTAGNNVQLGHIASAVQGIADKFRALSIIGITALTNIANRAVNAGLQFAKSFTVSPIIDGLHEYETNLNAVQTILANTGLEGQSGLNKVNAALNDLNHYSDKTIYNFSEMARNIGTFTAAGVKLDVATGAIKGIANLAAVSGSNAQQASTAMYQLSQALAAGTVKLEDWNSVVQAGMGGKVFQDALKQTARVHGVAIDQIIKDEGSFRNSLQKGWLTSQILTETLNKFTGDLTAKQLKAMGYNDKQIAGILKMAKTAQDAATKVKTFSQLIDTLKEAVGSGWAQTWQTLFGDFGEAKTLFTGLSNVIGGFIQRSSNARNKVLGDWKALGGRTALIQSVTNVFHALMAVIKPIKDAFREIFPPTTGKQLYNMTVALRDFTAKLKIGGDTADKLKRTFAGVFAVFGIGWDIIKEVAKTLFHLFGVASKGSGSFLDITASIGDFLVKVRETIHKGDALSKFFSVLGKILSAPIKIIQFLGKAIAAIFDGFKSSDTKSVTGFVAKLDPLGKLGHLIAVVWEKVISILDKVWGAFRPLADKFSEFFSNFSDTITNGIQNLNFGNFLDSVNTGLFAGLILLIRKFVNKFKSPGEGISGIVESITGPFEQLTKTLGAMQNTLRAATLLEIAAAIGIMAVAISVLSKIDGEGLKRSLSAMAVMFTQLFTSLAVFEKISGFKGFARMPFVAGAMILLAAAVDLLAVAVKKLSGLSWNELAKGLVGVSVVMGVLVASMRLMPNSARLVASSFGLIALAAAVKILASAVTDLSGLSWTEIAKGLVGVGTLLGSLALFTKFTAANKGGLVQGLGIILLASGIKILASAMKDLSSLSWGSIAKGLVAMAGGLTIIGVALDAIPPSSLLSAAAILVTAASLKMIGDALGKMGSMSWGSIAKSLVELAGALAIIAAAMIFMTEALPGAAALYVVAASLGMLTDALQKMGNMGWEAIAKSLVELFGALTLITVAMIFMTEALPGAAALLVVAAALAVLAPVLQTFGQMSWGEIAKGLLTLAGVFVVLGVAGVVLTPLVGTLLALGVAITLLGVGILAAGAGVFLFAAGLTALAAAGAAGAAAIVGIVSALVGLIPKVMTEIGLGIVAFAKVIATAGPAITNAITTVLLSLISAINKVAPAIVQTLAKLLSMMLDTMLKYVPHMTDTGLKLLIGILSGIARNIGRVVTVATNVIVAFLNGISNNLPRVVNAGVNLIVKFVNSIASAIRSHSAAMGAAGANLASAIIEGMARGLLGGIGRIASIARSVAQSALNSAKSLLGIHSPSKEFEKIGRYVNDGFLKGLEGNRSQIDHAFDYLKKHLLSLSKSAKASPRERTRAKSAYNELTRGLKGEHSALDKLSKKYDEYTSKIKDAKSALADAIKTRDDYKKTITDQYSALPSIGSGTRLPNYVKMLQKQITNTQEFATDLQKLRKLGLNNDAYKQLLSAGTDALPFVRQLIDSGKSGIDQINQLDSELAKTAAGLGKSASDSLYQAGVNAAAGLVKGLEKQQAAIQKQMDKIAEAMVRAIKKKLGIKSPSKVLAEVGEYSATGLAKGLEQASGVVQKSAENMGQNVIDSLSKSLSNMYDYVYQTVDTNPTISPVLDLTGIKKSAGQIGSIIETKPISVQGTLTRAQVAYDGYRSNQLAATDSSQPKSGDTLTFNQYNNSPKALSSAEIYRQTKNQLSVAKGALAKNAN